VRARRCPFSRTTTEYYDFYAEGRNGRALNGRPVTGVHVKGADCVFWGTFIGSESKAGVHAPKRAKADAGERVTVFSNEDFRVTGRCLDNGGGDFTADTRLAAKRNNLMYYAYAGDPFYLLDFDRADGSIDISDGSDATGTAPNYSAEDDYEDFFADGRGGEMLVGRLGTGVHVKNADCTFSGVFIG
jgi:hypothetical protein